MSHTAIYHKGHSSTPRPRPCLSLGCSVIAPLTWGAYVAPPRPLPPSNPWHSASRSLLPKFRGIDSLASDFGSSQVKLNVALQVAGTPTLHSMDLKNKLQETLNNEYTVANPTRRRRPLYFGTPTDVLDFSTYPRGFGHAPYCSWDAVPATFDAGTNYTPPPCNGLQLPAQICTSDVCERESLTRVVLN